MGRKKKNNGSSGLEKERYAKRLIFIGYSKRNNYDVSENGRDVENLSDKKSLVKYLKQERKKGPMLLRFRRGIKIKDQQQLEALVA